MTLPRAKLLRPQDLDAVSDASSPDVDDRLALRAIVDWIHAFVTRPHEELGRKGPVCPFVPQALERGTLWLAAERIGGRDPGDVVELVDGYRQRLLQSEPTSGDGTRFKAIVVVF